MLQKRSNLVLTVEITSNSSNGLMQTKKKKKIGVTYDDRNFQY